MRKKNGPFIFLALLLAISLAISPLCFAADESAVGKVTDLSDRKYEKAVIELLNNAKESVVISMYGVSLGSWEKNPIRLLLNDLLKARKRGLSVTMYLNSYFGDAERTEGLFIGSPVFKELKDAGCDIYLMPSSRMLHDKLIIVDSRYVIVGSTNWSNSALRVNFESNTLIDFPRHAKEKLKHLESVRAYIQSNSEISDTAAYLKGLPKELFIPKELLTNKKYFARMVTIKDSRAFNLYLLLLAHSQLTGEKNFFINLEDMALSLGLPDTWNYADLRRQIIKSLKKLQKRYKLIAVGLLHGKDASVGLLDIPGECFTIASDSIIQDENRDITLRLKFLFLIEALLKKEGKSLASVPKSGLASRFNVNTTTIWEAFNDLDKQH